MNILTILTIVICLQTSSYISIKYLLNLSGFSGCVPAVKCRHTYHGRHIHNISSADASISA